MLRYSFIMVKKLIVFLLFVSFTLLGFGGSKADSLLNSIHFRNNTEKVVFEKFLRVDSSDFFSMFYVADFDGTIGDIESTRRSVYHFIKQYGTEKFSSSSNKKKAKRIFNDVHDRFFKKYEALSFFHIIFNNGEFNCVSATALYAYIFESLNYDYKIRLMPNHVYIILFPESDDILIETTNPLKGYVSRDNKTKREYIDFLKNSKLISLDEYNSYSANELFQKYFYADKTISLKELVGVQYYNSGLNLFNQQKWKEALHEFEKAKLFYQGPEIDYLLWVSINNYFAVENRRNVDDILYLAKLNSYSKTDLVNKNIIAQFNTYIVHYLHNNSDPYTLTKAYNLIDSVIVDSAINHEVDFVYSYEMGRFFLQKGDYSKSNDYFHNSLSSKPKNIDAQSAFIQTLGSKIESLERDEAIEFMNTTWESYPHLHNNTMFGTMLGTMHLVAAIDHFNEKKISAGLEQLDKFEVFYTNNKTIQVYSDLVGEAYSAGAVYYFGRGQYSKARSLINRGLEISPNSYRLKRALNSL